MGYYIAIATCINCGEMFGCNPNLVPSIRVNAAGQIDPNGHREPVCKNCWDYRQAYLRAQGLPEETLLPGAYEPAEE